MNLLEVGKILRPHGIKGAVKVECYLDESFSIFKELLITNKKTSCISTTSLPIFIYAIFISCSSLFIIAYLFLSCKYVYWQDVWFNDIIK